MNVADMTCLEVNEALAKRRGESEPMTLYRTKDDGSLEILQQGYAPDYCRDWKWAGKVLEDMVCSCEAPMHIELVYFPYQGNHCFVVARHINPEALGRLPNKPGEGNRLAHSAEFPEAIARAGLQTCLDEDEAHSNSED